MANIVTVTLNPALDVGCTIQKLEAGPKLRCTSAVYAPGGGGVNVARAIGQLGGKATAVWASGGSIGQMLGELLEDEGVSHRAIRIGGRTRESFTVVEATTGREFRFVLPGPELHQEEAEQVASAVRELDPQPDYLVLSGSIPRSGNEALYARLSREAPSSCRVIVDTSGPALVRALEGKIYLIKPNRRELCSLAGRELSGEGEIEDFSRSLIRDGRVEVVVTTLGSDGAIVVTADRAVRFRAPEVDVQSTVGAGDSTVGGLTLALSRGADIVDAVRFGMAAGTAAVLTPIWTLCRREDTERLYGEIELREQSTPRV